MFDHTFFSSMARALSELRPVFLLGLRHDKTTNNVLCMAALALVLRPQSPLLRKFS
jgi:hypothetical protein